MDKYVCLYWMPRAGGTFIWQVLTEMGYTVASTHDTEWLNTELPLIIVYRDFRDVAVSLWRANNGEYDEEGNLINRPTQAQLEKYIGGGLGKLNRYRRVRWDNPNTLWLRYEDFFSNYYYLFGQFENFLGIKLTKEKEKKIIAETNLEYNRKRQKEVKPSDTPKMAKIRTDFDYYDPRSKLHRHHIHTGKVGTWKELVPKELHHLFDKLKPDLEEWEYDADED